MRLTETHRKVIYRVVEYEVGKHLVKLDEEELQKKVYKLMPPNVKRVFKTNPDSLKHMFVDDTSGEFTRYQYSYTLAICVGDLTEEQIGEVLLPHKEKYSSRLSGSSNPDWKSLGSYL